MSKKKKGKVVQLKPANTSPENYIKTQARSLPIAECRVTKDWENTGICNIIVARSHKNGNTTIGIYLVDLYCLGLKDAGYEFNFSPADYQYLKKQWGDMEACEYVLAHNIIFGAIAFAEDYGFKPHKDFAIAQYILEEDDENVPLMELDFGFEGLPFYMKGPYDDAAKVNNIKNTLMRTAGKGNFTIIEDVDGLFDDDEWLDDDDDNEWLDDDEDEDAQEDTLNQIMRTVKPVNKVYNGLRTPEGKEMLKKSTIGKGYRLVEKPIKNQYDLFADTAEDALYDNLKAQFEEGEFSRATKGLTRAVATYPDKARFYNLLQVCYLFNGQRDKSDKLSLEMYKKFPLYMFSIVPYANLLLYQNKPEEALAVFKGKKDLNELYPGQKQFNRHEAAIYYATMCRCFVALDDIDAADQYMNAIFKKDLQYTPDQTLINTALMDLCTAKIEKIKIKIGWNE